ncbi:hypothetical protein ERX35_009295 [Macrococcus equipercicus]|uniref:Nuclear transport factor 2 family protein n=1 Tax=Macrococcus equipercicus TaxID=69967 RepID=A0ABQ6R7B0_9STAP|nr:hypothetical protein [Macrococcus equipercicus]KAA1037741.1 hypothetical protein ERX35_009295 [Macrococcus equipercicus]
MNDLAHVRLLAAWQNQDIETIKTILSPELKASFVLPTHEELIYNYDQIINVFNERFKEQQEWRFDVLYKTERGTDNIVIIRIYREDDHYNLLEDSSLTILTFKTIDGDRKLIRMYTEMGITGA